MKEKTKPFSKSSNQASHLSVTVCLFVLVGVCVCGGNKRGYETLNKKKKKKQTRNKRKQLQQKMEDPTIALSVPQTQGDSLVLLSTRTHNTSPFFFVCFGFFFSIFLFLLILFFFFPQQSHRETNRRKKNPAERKSNRLPNQQRSKAAGVLGEVGFRLQRPLFNRRSINT
jgi:predicted PurR-regulated permease PerM